MKKSTEAELLAEYPEQCAVMLYNVYNVFWPPDIFEANPDLNKIYDMIALSTLSNYRGRGIAKKLVLNAWEVKKGFLSTIS